MRKKRFTAFLLSLAMAGTSLYTCGVIDVQAAAVAEEGTEDQNLEQLAELQEQAAVIEEDGAEAPASEEVAEPEQQAAAVQINIEGEGFSDGRAVWGNMLTAQAFDNENSQTYTDVRFMDGETVVGTSGTCYLERAYIGHTLTVQAYDGNQPVGNSTSIVVDKRPVTKDMLKFANGAADGALELPYDGTIQTPALIVSDDAVQVALSTSDYSPTSTQSEEIGEKYVGIDVNPNCETHTGFINVTQKQGLKFNVVPKEVTGVSVNVAEGSEKITYDGTEQKPAVNVTASDGVKLESPRDYTIAWTDNKNVGKPDATITLSTSADSCVKPAVSGPSSFTKADVFEIVSKNAAFTVGLSENKTSFGYGVRLSDIEAKLIVSDGQLPVTSDDYTVSVTKGTVSGSDPLARGTYELTVSGQRNYTPSSKGVVEFTVGGTSVSAQDIDVTISQNDYVYNGTERKPDVTGVEVNGVSCNRSEYDVTYAHNIDAGTVSDANGPQVIVTLKGNYAGTKVVSFNINPADIKTLGVTTKTTENPVYNGIPQKPKAEVNVTLNGAKKTLVEDTDYVIVSPSGNGAGDAGSKTATVSGCKNYTGTTTLGYSILSANISNNRLVDYAPNKGLKAEYNFTGYPISPNFTLEHKTLRVMNGVRDYPATAAQKALVKDTHYTVEYKNNTYMGTATVTITGKGNYTGVLEKTFKIVGSNITSSNVLEIPYTGKEVSVNDLSDLKVYSDEFVISTDQYTISLGDQKPKEIGTYDLTINGTNYYDGKTAQGQFKIIPRSISGDSVSYNGAPINGTIGTAISGQTLRLYYYKGGGVNSGLDLYTRPVISLSDIDNFSGISTDDYDFSFDRKTVSSGEYTLTGKGHYTGTLKGNFSVGKSNFEDVKLSVSPNGQPYVYTGQTIRVGASDFTVYDGLNGVALSLNSDFRILNLPQAVNAGTVYMRITTDGINSDYVGTYEVPIEIEPKNISDNDVQKISADYTAPSVDYTKDGGTFTPSANLLSDRLSYNGMHLTSNDYDVRLRNEKGEVISTNKYTDAGVYDIVAVGKGNYKGEQKLGSLTVEALPLKASDFRLFETEFAYTGSAHTPAVIPQAGHIQGQDFDVTYPEDSAERGRHVVTITGKGNYKGTIELVFVVDPITLSDDNTEIYYAGKDASGNAIVQVAVEGKGLVEGTDYTVVNVTPKPNTDPQEWDVTISGSDAYKGNVTKTVKEGLIRILDLNVAVSGDFTYNGQVQAPTAADVVVTIAGRVLSQNTDYDVTAIPDDSVNAGKYAVTVTGKGDYEGTANGTYVIKPAAFAQENVTVQSSVAYTGVAVEPVTIIVNGKTLVLNEDYTVDAVDGDMVNVGEKTLVITGIGNYEGSTATGTCTVTPASLAASDVTVKVTPVTYTGAAQTANVESVVKGRLILRAGVDYTVETKSATNVGTVKVTVTGKGNYTGTKTGDFVIRARSLASARISGVQDRVYTSRPVGQTTSVKVVLNGKTLRRNTDYTFQFKNNTKIGEASFTIRGRGNYTGVTAAQTFKILPKKETINALKAGSRRFAITAKRQGGGVQYQVQYRLKSSSRVTRVVSKKAKVVVRGLQKGKTYIVRVRTYKKVGGKNYYGEFSNARSIKIK